MIESKIIFFLYCSSTYFTFVANHSNHDVFTALCDYALKSWFEAKGYSYMISDIGVFLSNESIFVVDFVAFDKSGTFSICL